MNLRSAMNVKQLQRGYTGLLLSFFSFAFICFHSCMPSLLAPDPIRVQSCVCCLFWTNRNSMVVTSIFLSISLSTISLELWILPSTLSVNGHIYFYWNYSDLWVLMYEFSIYLSTERTRKLWNKKTTLKQ